MNRAELKQAAKDSLKGKWGLAVLTFLFVGLILIILQIPQQIQSFQSNLATFSGEIYMPDLGLSLLALITSILFLVFSTIVTPGLIVFILNLSRNKEAKFSDIFSRANIFFKYLGLSLLVGLKTLLWTLLFVIPGIIAAFRYSMAAYIMADHPEVGIVEAIEKSKQMMKGHKMELFVLSLSFIGWLILALIPLGIGFLWLYPYMEVTIANFYNKLSEQPELVIE
jgi:uncharacterized membrane protein